MLEVDKNCVTFVFLGKDFFVVSGEKKVVNPVVPGSKVKERARLWIVVTQIPERRSPGG